LDLRGAGIRDAGVGVLARALEASNLRQLCLSSTKGFSPNSIGPRGGEALARAVSGQGSRLARLSLAGVGRQGTVAFLREFRKALRANPPIPQEGGQEGGEGEDKQQQPGEVLVEESDSPTFITATALEEDPFSKAVAVAAPAPVPLRGGGLCRVAFLDVSGNGLGNEGLELLFDALLPLPNLTTLIAADNGGGDTAAPALRLLLLEAPSLTHLDVSNNKFASG